MNLFNKKYVYFMWNESLDGKLAFFSDYINELQYYVDNNVNSNKGIVSHGCKSYPFKNLSDDEFKYKFIYYDPNYKYKLAFSEGSIVEKRINKFTTTWTTVERLDDLDDTNGIYRIGGKLEKEGQEELVTHEELAKWLTKGNGLIMDQSIGKISTGLIFTVDELDKKVTNFLIRRYGEKEWHKPTKEFLV